MQNAFIKGNLLLNLLNLITNLILSPINQEIWIRFSNKQRHVEFPVKYVSNQNGKHRMVFLWTNHEIFIKTTPQRSVS